MINQIKSFNKRTIVIVVISSLAVVIPIMYLIHNSSTVIAAPLITKDPNLKVETVVTGLSSPTSMTFIDNTNMLVLEKSGKYVSYQMEYYKLSQSCKYLLLQKVSEVCLESQF